MEVNGGAMDGVPQRHVLNAFRKRLPRYGRAGSKRARSWGCARTEFHAFLF